ncbi:MAG: hypothetical protein Q4E42_00785 [Phascolarctobacterium sp.]|nr:hypothetical protein [Phascolarctobacterium sp.]
MSENRVLKRQSNIELMRVILMIGLTLHHIGCHGGLLSANDNLEIMFLGCIFLPLGKMIFCAFIFASMWFTIGNNFSGKKFLNIWFSVLFYNLLGMTLAIWLNDGAIHIRFANIIGCFLPLLGCSHGFAKMYLCWMLLFPFFSKITCKLSQKNILAIILLLSSIYWIEPVVMKVCRLQVRVDWITTMYVFFFVYFVVYYVKTFVDKELLEKICRNGIWGFLCFWFMYSVLAYYSYTNSNLLAQKFLSYAFATEIRPLSILGGGLLFAFFLGLKVHYSRRINLLAIGSFGVLLLHDHEYFRYVIWSQVFHTSNWVKLDFLSCLCFAVLTALIIYSIGCVIDMVRNCFYEKYFSKANFYFKCEQKLDEYFFV